MRISLMVILLFALSLHRLFLEEARRQAERRHRRALGHRRQRPGERPPTKR